MSCYHHGAGVYTCVGPSVLATAPAPVSAPAPAPAPKRYTLNLSKGNNLALVDATVYYSAGYENGFVVHVHDWISSVTTPVYTDAVYIRAKWADSGAYMKVDITHSGVYTMPLVRNVELFVVVSYADNGGSSPTVGIDVKTRVSPAPAPAPALAAVPLPSSLPPSSSVVPLPFSGPSSLPPSSSVFPLPSLGPSSLPPSYAI
jgi:hypothetical protein